MTDSWKLNKMSTSYLKTLQFLLKQNTTLYKKRYTPNQLNIYSNDLHYINIILEKRVTHKLTEWM